MKVKRTPDESARRLVASSEARPACDFFLGGRAGGTKPPCTLTSLSVDNARPVTRLQNRRSVRLLQRMTRETRAGRECQVSAIVPKARITRRVVRICNGGKVRPTHSGVTSNIRMKRVVKAGRVVADVGVRCVDKKSVRRRNGSSSRLQRVVNSLSVSTISSKLL